MTFQFGLNGWGVPGRAKPNYPDSVIAQYNAQQLSGTDGDTVTTFPDETGVYTATGGDGVIQDDGINGNRALNFSSATAGYTNSDFSATQKITIISVQERITTSTNSNTVYGDLSNLLHYWNGSVPDWRAFAGNDLVGSTDETTTLHTAVFDGVDSVFRENGTRTASGDAGANSLDLLSIGDSADLDLWDSLLGFVEIHEGEPSNGLEEREQEVANLWDITI